MKPTTFLRSIAALLILGLTAASNPVEAGRRQVAGSTDGSAPEEVDFSRGPAPGLKFRVTEEGEYGVSGTVTEGAKETRLISQDIRAHLSLVQTVQAADRGRVTRLERDYEAFRVQVTLRREIDGKPEERDWTQEHPLHGKRVRAAWQGEDLILDVREGDAWKPADAAVRTRLSSRKLLHPVLPLPRQVKRVGDSWTLSPAALADYFSDSFDESPEKVRVAGMGKVGFTGIESDSSGRSAVLSVHFDVKVSSTDHPGYRFRLNGTCRYNLEHRIVVALDAKGTMVTRGEFERAGRKLALDLSGTIQSRSRVAILATAPAVDPGGER